MDERTSWIAVALGAALVVSGCVAPASPPAPTADVPSASPEPPGSSGPDPPPSASPTPMDGRDDVRMLQYGCTTLFGIYNVPADEAQTYLPTDFRPQSVGEGQSSFMVKSWNCLRTVIDGRSLGPSNTSVYYLPVLPPETHRSSNISSYFVLIGLLTTGAEEAALYRSWNLTGARQGDVRIDAIESPAASVGSVAASDGGFAYNQTTTAGTMGRSAAFEARYFGVENGTATNAVDIPVSASLVRATGPAYLEFGEGSSPFSGFIGKGNGYHQYWGQQDVSYGWKPWSLEG